MSMYDPLATLSSAKIDYVLVGGLAVACMAINASPWTWMWFWL